MSLEDQTKVSKPLQRTEGHPKVFYFGTKRMTWSKKRLGKVNSAAVCRTFLHHVMTRKWVCGQKPGQSLTSSSENKTKFSSHQSTNFRVRYPACLDRFQVIALKLWIRRTVQTVFEGLGEKKGGREPEKLWYSERNTSCVIAIDQRGPERTRVPQ